MATFKVSNPEQFDFAKPEGWQNTYKDLRDFEEPADSLIKMELSK
jgi:hypothetical protein